MQELAQRYDRHNQLDWRDFNQPGIAAETPFSADELRRHMHVLTSDGQWHAGYFGWVAIASALPRWRSLASVGRWWPFRRLGPIVYGFVAKHRYRIPRFVLVWLGAPASCPADEHRLPSGSGQSV